MDQNFNIEVDNVVADDHVRVELLNLGEEKAEQFSLRVGLLYLSNSVKLKYCNPYNSLKPDGVEI